MAVHYRSHGIFLKKSARGEADELFAVYTKDFGKLNISGKAIRKTTSKLRGGAELFYLSDIEFIQGKSSKILTDAVLIENFKNTRHDLAKLRVAHKIAELLNGLAAKEEKDEKLWGLLLEVFNKLDNWKIENSLEFGNWKLEILYYYFFWHLVSILGYRPDISGCSIGGQKINCDAVKIIKIILKEDWHILSRLKIEPIHWKLLEAISKWYNNDVVGRSDL